MAAPPVVLAVVSHGRHGTGAGQLRLVRAAHRALACSAKNAQPLSLNRYGVEFAGHELDILASAHLAATAQKPQWLVWAGCLFMLESTFAWWLRRCLAALLATRGWSGLRFGWLRAPITMGACRMLAAASSSPCCLVCFGSRASKPSW
jgi:hypothetical protein